MVTTFIVGGLSFSVLIFFVEIMVLCVELFDIGLTTIVEDIPPDFVVEVLVNEFEDGDVINILFNCLGCGLWGGEYSICGGVIGGVSGT